MHQLFEDNSLECVLLPPLWAILFFAGRLGKTQQHAVKMVQFPIAQAELSSIRVGRKAKGTGKTVAKSVPSLRLRSGILSMHSPIQV